MFDHQKAKILEALDKIEQMMDARPVPEKRLRRYIRLCRTRTEQLKSRLEDIDEK